MMKIFYIAVILLGVVLSLSAAAVRSDVPAAAASIGQEPEAHPRFLRSAETVQDGPAHDHHKDAPKACCG